MTTVLNGARSRAMSVHTDVVWYGCPICHMIWPDQRLCCELTTEDPPDDEIEWVEFRGATLTEWRELPDDNPGGMHPGITRFACGLAGTVKDGHHFLHRAAWRVEFDDEQVEPMLVCYTCARELFGVATVPT